MYKKWHKLYTISFYWAAITVEELQKTEDVIELIMLLGFSDKGTPINNFCYYIFLSSKNCCLFAFFFPLRNSSL